jgi:hypothetical protein
VIEPSAFFVPAGLLWHPLRIIAAPRAKAAHLFIGFVVMVVLRRFFGKAGDSGSPSFDARYTLVQRDPL